MKTYKVIVTETVDYSMDVEAPDWESAENLAETEFLEAEDRNKWFVSVLDRSIEWDGDEVEGAKP